MSADPAAEVFDFGGERLEVDDSAFEGGAAKMAATVGDHASPDAVLLVVGESPFEAFDPDRAAGADGESRFDVLVPFGEEQSGVYPPARAKVGPGRVALHRLPIVARWGPGVR